MAAALPSKNSAMAFVLQASPWSSLTIRSGSSGEVSVEIPLHIDDDDSPRSLRGSSSSAAGQNATPCLVWQFRIEEYDIKFQLLENGQPLHDLVRYAADGMSATSSSSSNSNGSCSSAAVDPDLPPQSTTKPRLTGAYDGSASAEGSVTQAKGGALYTFRWDNSYSILRQKRVLYRFVVTSSSAYAAAQTAASETQQRAMNSNISCTSTTTSIAPVKPHLAKRLALERRQTVDEVSFEQTRAIAQLQRCVMDMVAAFVTDPDRPLHEGSIREFLLALEAVLRNGIKETFLIRAWPEEPYFEFLMQIGVVLRDDKGLIDDVRALPSTEKLQYLGWTRARALLLLALNKNMLHYAFENLIKRRSVVEAYYDSHGLLFMYSSATQIVSYLSALNGVAFLLAPVPDETFLTEIDLPPNLRQCAPNDDFEGDDAISIPRDRGVCGTGYVLRSGNSEDPDEMKTIENCSVARNVLANEDLQEISIGRGVSVSLPVPAPVPAHSVERPIHLLLQVRVTPGDIALSVFYGYEDEEPTFVIDPITIVSTDGWVDVVVIITTSKMLKPVHVGFDNSNAMVRARQVVYRVKSISAAQFDAAWESCHGVAQSISWKIATKSGVDRCQRYMEQLHTQQQHDVAEQQQRSREASGAKDDADNDSTEVHDSLFGMVISKPVSYLVGGFLGTDADGNALASCAQCLAPFSFFSRQFACPSCQSTVCIPCSRHTVQINGKGAQVKVCDRCFIKEKDAEKKRRAAQSSGDASSGGECAAYAALREDPSMDKYFKMLGFGVPHSGVSQKMLQDEMPSEKIVVFSAGPSGSIEDKAAASSGSNSGQRRPSMANAGSARGSSFRKVHWKSLETKKASSSIWNRATTRRKTAPIRLSPHDHEEVARLFAREAAGPGGEPVVSSKNDSTKKARVFSALDSRRSNNVSIGLSQFKAAGGADAILASLKACDFEFLTADRLANIYDIAPTSIEAKRYTNFRGSRARLEPAEKFLVDMCDISRVTEKIAAMRFVAQFDSQFRELRHRVQCITRACSQILHSERLARCFELVLAIGNLLNAGTEIENADGVTLESLLKLSETKSFDQTMTLLHFIVRLIHDRGEGDVLLFVQELSSIAEAKRFSNVICLSQAKMLQSGVAQAQLEIKEEMLLDTKRFEKAEEKRRLQHEQATAVRRHPSEDSSRATAGDAPPNPRAALHAMLQARNPSEALDPRAALNAMIRNRNPSAAVASQCPSTSSRETSSESKVAAPAQPRAALFAELHKRHQQSSNSADNEENSSDRRDVKSAGTVRPARNALLAAIRQRTETPHENPRPPPTNDSREASTRTPAPSLASISATKEDAPATTTSASSRGSIVAAPLAASRPPMPGLPPQGDLLAAIRSRRPRITDGINSTRSPVSIRATKHESTSFAPAEFVPRVYSVDDNSFINVMRDRVLAIKTMIEELEMDVETMVSMWESTARYLGEDPSGSSSEYVLQLLHRFILDVKIAKSLLSRQGLSFHTPGWNLQVGSTVATQYGPGVVTAIRGTDAKLEVAFPWSREAYLAPSSVLSVGAIVFCHPFGVGIMRSTHYDRGFCSVRFRFGFGIVRVHDVTPEASSTRQQLKQEILANGFRVGDPVTTPFGCGSVRSVAKHQASGQEGSHVAVSLLSIDGEEDTYSEKTTACGPVAFVQHSDVNMNY